MHLHESGENYLETILMLKREKGAVRSIDVALSMNFSKPSVSRAVNLLKEDGYITIDKEGWITLTEQGSAVAERIYERHRLLTEWLVRLGVPSDIAAVDACKIEHDLSPVSFERIRDHIVKYSSGK